MTQLFAVRAYTIERNRSKNYVKAIILADSKEEAKAKLINKFANRLPEKYYVDCYEQGDTFTYS